MQVVLIGAGLLFLYTRGVQSFKWPGQLAPTTPAALPPVDRLQPSKNDIIRPPDYYRGMGRDPLRQVGYVERVNGGNVKGDYPYEKYLGVAAVDHPFALHRRQDYQDAFVQQQRAYINDNYFIDPAYWNRGVKPYRKINSSGNPTYLRIAPPK